MGQLINCHHLADPVILILFLHDHRLLVIAPCPQNIKFQSCCHLWINTHRRLFLTSNILILIHFRTTTRISISTTVTATTVTATAIRHQIQAALALFLLFVYPTIRITQKQAWLRIRQPHWIEMPLVTTDPSHWVPLNSHQSDL